MLGTDAIVDATATGRSRSSRCVGDHNLFATQTVNQLPQAGTLTSARGNNFDADVYPDAPVDHVHVHSGPDVQLDAGHVQRHRDARLHGQAVRRLELQGLGRHQRRRHVVAHGEPRRRHALGDRDPDVDAGARRPVHERRRASRRRSPCTRRRLLRRSRRRPRRSGSARRRRSRPRRRLRHREVYEGSTLVGDGARRPNGTWTATLGFSTLGTPHADGTRSGSELGLLELVELELHRHGRPRCAVDHVHVDAACDDDVDVGDGERHGRGRLHAHALRRLALRRHRTGLGRHVEHHDLARRRRAHADGDADGAGQPHERGKLGRVGDRLPADRRTDRRVGAGQRHRWRRLHRQRLRRRQRDRHRVRRRDGARYGDGREQRQVVGSGHRQRHRHARADRGAAQSRLRLLEHPRAASA